MLADTAPLLEKERDTLGATFAFDAGHPGLAHPPSARAALAAGDHPMDAGEIDRAKIFQQWLGGDEADHGGRGLQCLQSGQSVSPVLDAHAEPDVGQLSHPAQLAVQ